MLKAAKAAGYENDIVFALDVSKSMLAEDIAPSRLDKSKQIINKVIDKLNVDLEIVSFINFILSK